MHSTDAISVVEAAYTLDSDTWLQHMSDVAQQCIKAPLGMLAYTFDLRRANIIDFDSFVFSNVPEEMQKAAPGMLADVPKQIGPIDLTLPHCSTASVTIGGDPENGPAGYKWYHETVYPMDTIGVVARADVNTGIVFSGFLDKPTELPASVISQWRHLTVHIGAGARLRRVIQQASERLGDTRALTEAEGTQAILSPNGKVEHAEATAKHPKHLEALRESVARVERARGPLRHEDAMEATKLWRGLTSGRWSLVDSFESDGRRYYVAHENPMFKHPSLTALTEREQQVVAGAVTGLSDKLIAYSMGLTRSTVASHLASARRKLRVSTRIELVALGQRLAAGKHEHTAGEDGGN